MSTLLSFPSIVLAGAWNPAIIQPNWLAQEVFEQQDGDEMPVQMEFSPTPGLPPRFILQEIRFVPTKDRLIISPENTTDEALNLAENKARAILQALPHTPVQAIGQNFDLIEENPSDSLLSIFNLNDSLEEKLEIDYTLSSTTVAVALDLGDYTLNLSRKFSEGNVLIKFNFHYDVINATNGAERLPNTFRSNFKIVQDLLNSYEAALTILQEANDA